MELGDKVYEELFMCGSGPTGSQAVAISSTSVATPSWSTMLGSIQSVVDALSDSASVDWSKQKFFVTCLQVGDSIADSMRRASCP